MVKTDLLNRGGRNIAFLCFLLIVGIYCNTFANNTESIFASLACNDNVQVSLNADCQAVITPDMILEGEESIPGYDPANYTITLNGTTAATVPIDEIGFFTVVVNEISTGNSCWGHITVEDKLPPVLDCPCPVGGEEVTEFVGTFDGTDGQVTTCGDLSGIIAGGTANYQVHYFRVDGVAASFSLLFTTHTIGCNMAAFVYEGFNADDPCVNVVASGDFSANIPVDGLADGIYQIVIYSDPTVPNCEYALSSSDVLNQYAEECVYNCTDKDAILDDILLLPEPTVVNTECDGLDFNFNDTVEPSDCAASVIRRTYVYTDGSGNSATCTIEFYLQNIGLDDITPPVETVEVPCSSSYTPEYIANQFGVTYGWPTIDGVAITGAVCGLAITHEDQNIPICPGEFKVLRTWTIVDWCTGDIETYTQIIKLIGPELLVICPDDGAIGYTNHYGCVGDIVIDPPTTNKDFLCSALRYTVGYLLADENGEAPTNGIYTPVGYDVSIEDQILVSGLGLGKNWIKYTVFDQCGRIENCFTEVVIHDNVPPNPVCDEFTVVSLTSLGWAKIFAETFNAGSFDNCGDITYYVRRMDDNAACRNDPHVHLPPVAYVHYEHNYYEYVPFCCNDLDGQVMIEMIVVDNAASKNLVFVDDPNNPGEKICIPDPDGHDNVNFCMVEVDVQDKSKPEVFCPDDVTIHCTQDSDDLSLTGEANLIGICENGKASFTDRDFLDDCGYGHIRRTWFAPGHQQYGCDQYIWIPNPGPGNVYFPSDDEVDCTTLPGPEQPWWDGDACALFGWSIDSDTFYVEDGACAKILNHYTVIDWCVYNPGDPLDAQYPGVWTGTQIIKVFDDVAPEVDCEDEMFGIYEEDCLSQITISAVGTDLGNCPSNWLKWKIKIDLWDDGIIDYTYSSHLPHNNSSYIAPTSSGAAVSVTIPEYISSSMHNHSVEWTVTDGCGNIGSCTSMYMVVDKKPPTPYCINLSTALMENGSLDLWACDFDLGSFDNCSDHLSFTFRGDIDTPEEDPNFDDVLYCSSRTFTCADLPENPGDPVPIDVWVWDEKNNKDYCTVYLTLVDNNNACGSITGGGETELSARIAGQIMTEEGLEVSNVQVQNASDATTLLATDMTDIAGVYAFEENPMYVNYAVSASKNDDFLNGVSTLDLVLIQKHILGLDMLSSGYKVVAADVNNDAKVSAVDLIELRKLILGIYHELPNNNSWRFVDSDQVLNQFNPWPLLEESTIQGLVTDMTDENFIGVKVGDVNGNAHVNFNETGIEGRSANKLVFVLEKTSTGLAIKAGSNFENISGYQFTLAIDGSVNAIKASALDLTEANFGVLENNIVTTSFADAEMHNLSAGDVIFTIEGATNAQIVNGITKAEAYRGSSYEVMNIGLRNGNGDLVYSLSQNEPNPFSDNTSIGFTIAKSGLVNLNIFDVTGKVVKDFSQNFEKGSHTINLSKDDLQSTGILYYSIKSGNFTDTKKMILVK